MRPKLLVDMNLSPQWIPVLQHGWPAVHWSDVGDLPLLRSSMPPLDSH